jgi:hypothetical protein
MYKVQYKSHSAFQSWANFGNYGTESVALSNADRASAKYFMVRVIDRDKRVVWCAQS